jgi:hypothetical protein
MRITKKDELFSIGTKEHIELGISVAHYLLLIRSIWSHHK